MSDTQKTADLIVIVDHLITMNPGDGVLERHGVAVLHGNITAVLPADEFDDWNCSERLDLIGHALLPGLVNAHNHGAMSLLRGYADDLPLMPWLEEHIWPAEGAHVSPAFVSDGVALAITEMIRGGTTTFTDMYFFPEDAARVCFDAGMRVQLAAPIFEFPSAYGSGADDYISKALALRDTLKSEPLATVAFGPHAPYTVSVESLERIATYAAELDMAVHMHLHETQGEVLSAVEANGERPLDTLRRIGLLGPRTQCIHMTDLGSQDIANLAETGAHVIHCPESNMKLASGICPTPALKSAGVNVALGTDGCASNNDLNMFGEMRSAALLAKVASGDPTALPAMDALHMATLGGARALGLDERIGSLEPGKAADMIAVDLRGPATQPLYNAASQLVYACNGSEVSHSWVAGRCLLAQGRHLTIDPADVLGRAQHWQSTIASAQ